MVEPNVGQNAASVAVKLPDFWRTDPEMWFAQAEAQFMLAGVTRDETKFYHIVAKVDQTVICHISDLVQHPPEQNKYQSVKERLIARFSLSPEAKLEKLLGSQELGDLRPTHLLAKMQELSTGLVVDSNLLKMLFLQRLPPNIRSILSICNENISNIAQMADKMVDCASGTVASVNKPEARQDDDSDDLKGQIAALTAEVRRLKVTPQRFRSRSSSRNRSEVCWYHRQYGNNARQCRSPCAFTSKN